MGFIDVDFKQERMKVTIQEHFGYGSILVVALCPTCNKEFVHEMPSDPGNAVYHMIEFDMCSDCNKRYMKSDKTFPIHPFSKMSEVNEYRKSQGFPTYSESLSDTQTDWLYREDMANEQNGDFDGMMGMTERDVVDMAYVYGAGPNPLIYDEDYYDPHADLMRDRARELGVI